MHGAVRRNVASKGDEKSILVMLITLKPSSYLQSTAPFAAYDPLVIHPLCTLVPWTQLYPLNTSHPQNACYAGRWKPCNLALPTTHPFHSGILIHLPWPCLHTTRSISPFSLGLSAPETWPADTLLTYPPCFQPLAQAQPLHCPSPAPLPLPGHPPAVHAVRAVPRAVHAALPWLPPSGPASREVGHSVTAVLSAYRC